jgi:DNA-binding beta-propeller fold protein YncE
MRRMTRQAWAWLLLAVPSLAVADTGPTRTWTFEDETPGAIAQGFTAGKGEWKVVASAEGKALAQLAESPDADFNVALIDGTNARDVDLSVRVQAIAGVNDQGGGLVWRARDARNYYVARYNHLEDNFRVDKVVDGVRSAAFQNAKVKHHDGWTVVRVTMTGDHIEGYLDGVKFLDATDATFPEAGRVGLWSKADARSRFDDLTLADPATSAPLVRVATIPLAGPVGGLDHLALDARRGRLFVANTANNSLDVVDLRAGRLLTQVPGQGHIQGIAYAADLDRVFVGNGTGGVFAAIDGEGYRVLKTLALGDDADNVRYNPSTRRAYVVHADEELAVIDARTYATRSPIALPKDLGAFQLESRRPRMYLNAKSAGQVIVIDTQTDRVIDRFPVAPAGMNAALAIDEPGRLLFVGCRKEPSLVVMDADTGRIVARVPLPGDVDDLYLDAKRGRIYASCGDGAIAVIQRIDATHYAPLATIATLQGARTSYFDPESGRLYLAVPRRAERPGQANPEVWVYQARP